MGKGTRENQYVCPEHMSRQRLIERVHELEGITQAVPAPRGFKSDRSSVVVLARRALRIMATIPEEEFNDGDAMIHDLAHGVLTLDELAP